jgi:hypothetical protein
MAKYRSWITNNLRAEHACLLLPFRLRLLLHHLLRSAMAVHVWGSYNPQNELMFSTIILHGGPRVVKINAIRLGH